MAICHVSLLMGEGLELLGVLRDSNGRGGRYRWIWEGEAGKMTIGQGASTALAVQATKLQGYIR